jgi:hypothetical protein
MTASRAEDCRAAALAAFLTICASPAVAQTLPNDGGVPATLPAAAPQSPPVPVSPPAGSPIQINILGSPDGPPPGLLDSTNGGLAADIWSGSPRGLVETLLARLPLATPVASVRKLARRLLLTKADSPLGQAPHAFQTVRVEALLNAGYVADAGELAAQTQLKDDPEFARVQADAVLLAERTVDACGNATLSRLTNADAFWIQLRAYCYGAGAQSDMLDLTRSVMKAQGTDDPAFEILLDDTLTHKAADPGEMREPSTLDVFLLQLVGLPLSPGLAANFGLPAGVLALRDGNNPPNVRADAAEQVVHSGAVSPVELGVVADAQTFTPAQLAMAETAGAELPFFADQALTRQAAAHEVKAETKASLLFAALSRATSDGLLPVAAGLQESAVASLTPDANLRPQAPLIARALLLAGNPDAAERWRQILDPDTDRDRPLAAALAIELFLKAPDAGRTARAQQAVSWLAQNAVSLQPMGGPEMQRYGALAIGVCDALDEIMPPDAKAEVAALETTQWPGRQIAPSVRKRLAEARGQPGLKGEALLTILDTVGAEGPGDLSPNATVELVRALKAEGEPEAARAFASDALLLYQPVPLNQPVPPTSFHMLPPTPPAAPPTATP